MDTNLGKGNFKISSKVISQIKPTLSKANAIFGIGFLAVKSCVNEGKISEEEIKAEIALHINESNSAIESDLHPFAPTQIDSRGELIEYIFTLLIRNSIINEIGDGLFYFHSNYLLKFYYQNGNLRIPLLALALWDQRNDEFIEPVSENIIIANFIAKYELDDDELLILFETSPQNEFEYQYYDIFDIEDDKSEVANEEINNDFDESFDEYEFPPSLEYMHITNIGPANEITIEPSQRMNILTGDNGLGKTFLLDCIWWALSGSWSGREAIPSIGHEESSEIHTVTSSLNEISIPQTYKYNHLSGTWPQGNGSFCGIVIYVKVDGTFHIKLPQVKNPIKLTEHEAWYGVNGKIEGLIRDVVKWQSNPEKYPFVFLENVLKKISPPDLSELKIGEPVRRLGEISEIPTIIHPYGPVPIHSVSAGIKRAITIAYAIVWAWYEHNIVSELKEVDVYKRLVLIVDEIESHLHPKWQRGILPSLIEIENELGSGLQMQSFISTHSPLVMASIEQTFNQEKDTLYHLSIDSTTGQTNFTETDFIKHGHIDSWLTSEVFELLLARSKHAEDAIIMAKDLQLAENPSLEEIKAVHENLANILSPRDPFWQRWIYFAESRGLII